MQLRLSIGDRISLRIVHYVYHAIENILSGVTMEWELRWCGDYFKLYIRNVFCAYCVSFCKYFNTKQGLIILMRWRTMPTSIRLIRVL